MNGKRTWIVAGTTLAIAGFAGAGVAMAADDVELNDQRHAPVVQLTGDQHTATDIDTVDTANTVDSPPDVPAPPPAQPDDSVNTANTPD